MKYESVLLDHEQLSVISIYRMRDERNRDYSLLFQTLGISMEWVFHV